MPISRTPEVIYEGDGIGEEDIQEREKYWTEERMRDAKPMPIPYRDEDFEENTLDENFLPDNPENNEQFLFSYGKNADGIADMTRVEIIPINTFWRYGKSFLLEVSSGISGTEGNIPTDFGMKSSFTTLPFAQIEEKKIIGPKESVTIAFDQAPDSLSAIQSHIQIEGVAFSLEYKKICKDPEKRGTAWEDACEKIDDTRRVALSFHAPLENEKKYEIRLVFGLSVILEKDESRPDITINEGWLGKKWVLPEDISLFFTTPELPKILGTYAETENYREFCIYTNNPFDEKSVRENVRFEPPLPTDEMYVSNQTVYDVRQYENPESYGCNQPEYIGKNVVVVQTKLDFETKYLIHLGVEIKDIYGQPLGKEFSFSRQTEEVKNEDIALNSISPERYVIAPFEGNASVVFASQNLPDELQVDICQKNIINIFEQEMNLYNFYSENKWIPDEKSCDFFQTISIPVPKRSWREIYTEVNLKEILGSNFTKGAYIVSAHHPRLTSTIYISEGEKEVPEYRYIIAQISDFSLIAKKDSQKSLIWLSKISDGSGISDAEVSLFARKYQNGPVDKLLYDKKIVGKTNAEGILSISDSSPWEYISAQKDDDRIVMPSYAIVGREGALGFIGEQTRAYIFTDRPIYKPGDKVQGKAIFISENDVKYEFKAGKMAPLRVQDSSGNEILEKQNFTAINEMGGVEFSFPIPVDASLGDATIQICEEVGNCFWYTFAIEEYKKPELSVEADVKKENYFHGETSEINVSAQYYFGAPVNGAEVDYSLKRDPYHFDRYTEEEGYIFKEGNSIRPWHSSEIFPPYPYEETEYLRTEKRTLSADGKTTFSEKINLPLEEKAGIATSKRKTNSI